ncbi:MAG: alpha-2-macroglobulin family protein [Pseudomonadota bacterium]
MRILKLALMAALWASVVTAQDIMPPDRYIVTRDVDFFGADRSNLFDTTVEACQRACSADAACVAYTFNDRSKACFPKSAISDRQPYVGAISAERVVVPAGVIADASARAAALPRLQQDHAAARALAAGMGQRYAANGQAALTLIDAAQAAWQRGERGVALRWLGAAVALTDAPDLWVRYANYASRLGETVPSNQRRKALREAVPAALNGYVRATTPGGQATALVELSRALELNRRGRDMIDVLRLAQSLQPRDDTETALDAAIAKYGFRITEHEVDNQSAAPRICATFSEPLIKAGFDYEPYVRADASGLVVQAEDRRLCLDGAQHGQRYAVTFRAGLPAASGETLVRNVALSLYVRDRDPVVRFPGRSYVLAKGGAAALPIETVNLDQVDLALSRVSDRNLVRALRDDYFGRPLSQWQEEEFNDSIAQEIWRGIGQVENTLNTETRTRLPLDTALEGQPAGVYVLRARVPGSDPYEVASATQWFVLSDLGVSTWQGNDGLTAAVRALSDAGPVGDATVTLVSRANAVLATATSDADGFVTFGPGVTRGRGAAAPALLQVSQGDDFVFLPLTDPAFDLSDRGVEGRPPAPPIDVFMTTDRGAYRPGATIHITALTRDARAGAISGLPLTAILTRPDGVELSRVLSAQDQAGGHVFHLPLPVAAPLGTWRIALKSDLSAPALTTQTVLVEDFVPERIDVNVELPDGDLRRDMPVPVTVDARYLFGAPGADLAVEGELRVRQRNTIDGWPGYRFGRHDAAFSPRQRYLDAPRTGPDGMARILMDWPETEAEGVLLEAQAVIRVSDGAGRPVERSVIRPVAPDGAVIGIRPTFDDVLAEGAEAGFDLIAAGTTAPVPVRWTVNRIETRYQWYQLFGDWNWEPITRRERVAQGDAMLGEAPVPLSVATDWGQYELVVERSDGIYTASSVGFSAGWYGGGDSSDTPDRLPVSLNADTYAVGATARLRLLAPFDGTVLLSVLSDQVIERRAVPVVEGENLLDLTVTDDWGSGAYVTAALLRGVAGRPYGPTRALGLAHAKVDPGPRALTVTVDAPDAVGGQAGTTDVVVSVDGLDGNVGFVTLAAVDLGILNLTGFDAPDPQGHYFGQRRLGVGLRDLYGRLIDGQSGALGQIRSGGDAGSQLQRQAPPPTEAIMADFAGPVAVGPDGTATITVNRPDFNGTIRLMAVAWSAQGVGQAEKDMVARDPVVMSVAAPRFMAPGDSSRIALELVHADGPVGTAMLTLTGAALGLDATPRTIDIGDGGTVRVSVPIIATDVGDHTIAARLETPDGTVLQKTYALGVRANDPTIAVTQRLSLASGAALTLDDAIFADLRPATARATVAAGPLARFDVPGLLRQLDRYPYGCTEQVTSAAMPLLFVSDLAGPSGFKDIDTRIDGAIARVLLRQASNGAFGLWRAQSGEFWLDAYVTDFLSRARAAGHAVPETAMRLALDNLRNRVNYAADFDSGGEEIAYALYVLAREGAAQIGDLRYYADAKATAFATPLARAQLGAALAAYGEQTRADTMFGHAQDLALNGSTQRTSWRDDFGTRLRDAAGVLHLASEAGSTRVDATRLASVITDRQRLRGLSTQEAAHVVMAANALRAPSGLSTLSVDGAAVTGPVILSRNAGQAAAVIENTSDSAQDVTLTTLGVPLVAPEASGYGYALQRRTYTMDGASADGPWTMGERRVVVIEVTPFEAVGARLIVDDPLPAGLEIDNPNLLRAGDIRALDWLKPANAEHAEFRADRFIAAVDHRSAKPFQLAYTARAVSPGDFHHPAALVEDMYRPEYRAVTGTGRVQVVE